MFAGEVLVARHVGGQVQPWLVSADELVVLDIGSYLTIYLARAVSLTIYLLIARIYKGELSTLPGIYFSECFRDLFGEISSRAQTTAD